MMIEKEGGLEMKFCWTTLHVSDMEASLKFYHEILGLPISSRLDLPDVTVVMLGDGESKIELLWNKEHREEIINNYMSIGFTVESLESMKRHLEQYGIQDIVGPVSPNPHVQFLFVKDPDGSKVQLVENL
jgi:lactoylglutathione lyase